MIYNVVTLTSLTLKITLMESGVSQWGIYVTSFILYHFKSHKALKTQLLNLKNY